MRSREFSRVATMTRAMPAESSTPATSGPLGPTVRAPGALAAVTSPVQTLAHRNPCFFDGFGQLFGVAATGRRVVDATAALSVKYRDRKSTRLNSSHLVISYAVFCLKKKK